MKLPERIKKWREWAGLTPSALAAECDVTPTAVYHWELGNSTPTLGHAETIAKACGITVAMFWSEVPPTKRASA